MKRILSTLLALTLLLSLCAVAQAETTPVRLLTWSNASTVGYLESIAAGFQEAYPQY